MDYAHPAVQGVIYCDKLFAIEKYCREHAYTAEQRHAYRLKKAPPVLQAFWKWLESLQDADPKSHAKIATPSPICTRFEHHLAAYTTPRVQYDRRRWCTGSARMVHPFR